MRKIYTFLVLVLSFGVAQAQTVSILNNLGTSGNIVVGGSSYHVIEAIYTDAEIGASNFTTAGTAIQKINFFLYLEGAPNTINNYNIWMKNVAAGTTTLATGTYSRTGYTQVYSGTFTATPAGGPVGVTLTTPFTRTAGSNLQVLIERLDNTAHTGYSFYSANGNNTSTTATTSRRYNSTIAPVSGTTTLTASAFRPAVQFIHQYPVDATVIGIENPAISCYNSPQSIGVEVYNEGTGPIAAGAATVHLDITGPNTYTGTATNTGVIAPGASEVVYFTGVTINNAGENNDSAYVNVSGDGYLQNDYFVTTTTTATTLGTSLSEFPITEDAETTLPVFPYARLIAGDSQLWTLQTGKYANTDQVDSLAPRAPGSTFYLFDSYSGASSVGFESRLYSNCVQMPTPVPGNPAPVTTVSFWRSRDSVFSTSLDSLYLSVSTDKGATWTRIAGFERPDPIALLPYWKNEVVDVSAYNGQVVQFGFEGVSQYGNIIGLDDIVINYSGLAPVSLLSFDAKRSGRVNQLNWTTSQEVNTSHFVVERSADGRTFTAIGEVTAAGNSTSAKDYRYMDATPAKGINYYRLRMIDNDNAFKISEIKNVKNLGVADISVNPNPVQQQMKVVLEAEAAERATLTITDLSGRKIYTGFVNVVVGTNNFEVPASQLSKGSYIVTVQLNGQTLVKRINKL